VAYPCGRHVGQAQGTATTQKHYLNIYISSPPSGLLLLRAKIRFISLCFWEHKTP